MQITESIELLEGMPIAYIKPLNSLIISDTHLGYEGQMSMAGTLIPSRNLQFIEDIIRKAVIATGANRLIVTGDLKNDFSDLKYYERKEIGELIEFCNSISIKLLLIKGNHDNYLDRIKNTYDVEIIKDYLLEEGFYIAHGDELPKCEAEIYIIGHEHPSVIIYRYIGAGEKMKAFLYGNTKDGKKLLVLPACSIFAPGSNINEEKREELLSPFLKEMCDVDELNAICISEGENLNFGKIKDLRNIIV
jgi:hypothetical protein